MTWHRASTFDRVHVCSATGDRWYVKSEPVGMEFLMPGPFLAGPRSSHHDQALTGLAARLNALLAEVPVPESDDGHGLSFVRADQGIVLVWSLCPTNEEYKAKYAGRGQELENDDQISTILDLGTVPKFLSVDRHD